MRSAEKNLLQFVQQTYTKKEIRNKSIKEIAKEYMEYMIDFQDRLVNDAENSEVLKRNIFNRINR